MLRIYTATNFNHDTFEELLYEIFDLQNNWLERLYFYKNEVIVLAENLNKSFKVTVYDERKDSKIIYELKKYTQIEKIMNKFL